MSATNPEILVFDTELKEQRSYWLKRLARRPEASSLTPDYDRPKEFVRAAAGVPLSIEGELYARLTKLTGRSPFLLLTTLTAALKVCLHKYQPDEPTFVGTPALGHVEGIRQQQNALVMVDEVSDGVSFRELLLKVRETLLEAYAKARYPFQRLARDFGLVDSEARCPFFQVALVLTDIHGDLPDVKNDITLTFSLEADRVSGAADYHAGLFRRESIERFTRHFLHVLGQALANPAARVHELLMLTEDERRLLAELNETRREFPHDRCAHELFEARAAQTPDAPAVIFRGRALSYRELNERANRLARHLRERGVGPETRVGIMLGRSAEMVVALLAVWKAGGAYVPLDPDYPRERLAFMLGDAGVRLLLTRRPLLDSSPPEYGGDAFCFEDEAERCAVYGPENLPVAATPLNLAYVIYTSGSTGRPKGTMVTQRGLVNYLSWSTRAYRAAEGGGAPVHSPLGFDLTVTSLFAPLMSGRPVVLLPEEEGVEGLGRELRRGHDFGLVKITPAHLDVLAQLLGDEPAAQTTRALVVGGEALRGESLEWWRTHAPEVRVVNEYGPTETVVGCCVYEVAARDVRPGAVPIGRPIANTRLYVLDGRLELTPMGLPGQLYIGGCGLARGYLGRPDLTAETFVPDPFGAEPGARLYRTGDVVRHLSGGDLEYLGRIDHQVKVRGYRIELGEVEAALVRHDRVREAVAVVHAGADGDKRLAAYVVTEGAGEEPEVLAARWREFLKGLLPDYMIPSAFVVLEALPLTAHGKVDRRALPSPGPAVGGGYVAPRTAAEEVLAGIWAEVLGAPRVGVRDNFFELGGHSLLATQVASRVHQVFGVEVALRSLFEHPTVEGLAEEIEKARGERPAGGQSPPLVPVGRDDGEGLPPSYAQQRLWFLHQLQPLGAAYNVPVAMRLTGRLGVAALEQTVNELVRRHESLRTTFANVRGQLRQIISEPAERGLPLVDLTRLDAPEQERVVLRLAREEALRPFDLSAGPLLRVSLLRLGGEHHVVLFTMHHIVSDGWSMEVLVRELSEIYRAYASLGVPSPLAPLPVQYADFAVWQRRLVEEKLLDRQLAYWKERLGGTPPRLELPADRPRPAVNSYRGARHSFTLPARLTAELRALARREGATLYMVLLSVFKALLALYSGQEEVVVGSPVANRVRVETEGLIGCLINTLALRTRVGGNPNFRELLARVREVVLGAHAHQEIPFELVVEALQPERRGNYNPLFQVWFMLQSGKGERLESAGLTLKPLEVGVGSAQFDLTLAMEEHGAEVAGSWSYSTDLFDRETVVEMAGHYRGLLESVLTPDGIDCGILDISLSGAGAAPRAAPAVSPGAPDAHEEEGQYAF